MTHDCGPLCPEHGDSRDTSLLALPGDHLVAPELTAFEVVELVRETHLLYAVNAAEASRLVLSSAGNRITVAREPVRVESVRAFEEARANV